MPSASKKQRNYIFYLRGKYKDKASTPEDQKWIWDSGWEEIKKENLMKPYIRQFIEETQKAIIDKELYESYESLILEESFFDRCRCMKDVLSKIKSNIKKFVSHLYTPVRCKNLDDYTARFEMLYPDNRTGILEVYFDFRSGNAAITKSKGNEKYFKDKNLVEITIKEVMNIINTL